MHSRGLHACGVLTCRRSIARVQLQRTRARGREGRRGSATGNTVRQVGPIRGKASIHSVLQHAYELAQSQTVAEQLHSLASDRAVPTTCESAYTRPTNSHLHSSQRTNIKVFQPIRGLREQAGRSGMCVSCTHKAAGSRQPSLLSPKYLLGASNGHNGQIDRSIVKLVELHGACSDQGQAKAVSHTV